MLIKFIVGFIVCILISFIDIKNFIIPDFLVITLFIFFLIFDVVYEPNKILLHVGHAAFIFTLFSCMYIFSKGIGFGDVKLITTFAYGFGFFETVYISLFASLSGLLYVLVLAIPNYNKKRACLLKVKIPFAPFLTAGLFVVGLINEVSG